MQNAIDPILITAFITVIIAVTLAIYFFYTYKKTSNLYLEAVREFVKVRDELLEAKRLNNDLEIGKMILSDMCTKGNSFLIKEMQKSSYINSEIQFIGRRISIKDLEAFKQRCANIYTEPTAE